MRVGCIPNTVRRGGIYHFRRAVPVAHRERLRLAELTCSLRTHEAGVARLLSRRLYLRSEELFGALASATMLSDEDIASLVRDFYAVTLKHDGEQRLMTDLPDAFRAERVEHYRDLAARSREDLASNAFGSVRQITSVMLARRYGAGATFDKHSVRKVSQAMLRAGIEVAETLKARAEGNFSYEPRDGLVANALAERAGEPPAVSPMTTPPQTAITLFSAEAERFREAQLRRRVWEKQTALQARKTYALWLEQFGDRALMDFARRDAAAFKQVLCDLPAAYGKSAEFRGMTTTEIVRASKDRTIERLSSRTIQRHFAALTALWQDAIDSGQATENIFTGWKFPATKRAQDQRSHWTRDQLAKLFETPIWSGCQSAHRRSSPGTLILRDERFWLPIIAVFSGMRQEEICQLRLSDVRKEEGVWVFDLNARDGQQLKNANAKRLVPVHGELIRLGLLTYADRLRSSNRHMLFPDLQPGGADNRLGHNYSKWFSRYRRDVGLYQPRLDFHSFRHSATTFLRQNGVDEPTVDELTGHATAGETARYSKGLTVANLWEAMEKLSIGVDLTRLYPGPV